MAWQRHGGTVTRAQPRGIITPGTVYDHCDGLWSDAPGRAMLLLTADCMPIAIARSDGLRPAVEILHAGWRGLLAGIVAAGVRAIGARKLVAAIGPSIGPCCYEVGRRGRGALPPGVRRRRRARRRQARSLDGGRARAPRRGRRARRPLRPLHRVQRRPLLLAPPRPRHARDARESLPTSADALRERYERVQGGSRPERHDRRRDEVRLARRHGRRSGDAGVSVVGENRAQDLEAKHARYGDGVPVALHRPPAKPEGEDGERDLRALPFARLRVRCARSSRSRRSSR